MTNKERKEKGMVYRYGDSSIMDNQFLYQAFWRRNLL